MINLAGVDYTDTQILEELYLAGLQPVKCDRNNGEVKYSYIAKVGKWILKRAWRYWIAYVDEDKDGLILNKALELHNKKHPTKDINLGEVIRSGGHGGSPSPDEFGAQPLYDEEFNKQLIGLGYEEKYNDQLKLNYIPITVGEVSKLCNEGKLKLERYVDSYHIDDQIGLNEFVKTIKSTISPLDKYDSNWTDNDLKIAFEAGEYLSNTLERSCNLSKDLLYFSFDEWLTKYKNGELKDVNKS